MAAELARQLPCESLLYLGDSARCPYGPRDPQELVRFVLEIGSWLERQAVKLIVIACNTATAAGLREAQQACSVPVLGVVQPGARAALHVSRTRRIGVIGTTGTIKSSIYEQAIHSLDAGAQVFSQQTQEFVELVEEGFTREISAADKTKRIRLALQPFSGAQIDTLVLGCTHFPVLHDEIAAEMGSGVHIISSAEETAREVREILKRKDALSAGECSPTYRLYTTGQLGEFTRLAESIFPYDFTAHAISLDELADKRADLTKPQIDTPER